MKRLAKYMEVAWAFLLTLGLISTLLDTGFRETGFKVFSEITFPMLITGFVLTQVALFLYKIQIKYIPALGWSLATLFRKREININILPLRMKYFGPVFLLLLVMNAPLISYLEELGFREGLTSWYAGIFWCVLFGFTHCLTGVSISAGLAIGVVGLWFTHQYFLGGVALSTLHHTSYNLVIFSVIFIAQMQEHGIMIRQRFKKV